MFFGPGQLEPLDVIMVRLFWLVNVVLIENGDDVNFCKYWVVISALIRMRSVAEQTSLVALYSVSREFLANFFSLF